MNCENADVLGLELVDGAVYKIAENYGLRLYGCTYVAHEKMGHRIGSPLCVLRYKSLLEIACSVYCIAYIEMPVPTRTEPLLGFSVEQFYKVLSGNKSIRIICIHEKTERTHK